MNNETISEKWLNKKANASIKNIKEDYNSITKMFLEQKYNKKDNNKLSEQEINSNIKMLESQIKNIKTQIKLLKENKITSDQLGQI